MSTCSLKIMLLSMVLILFSASGNSESNGFLCLLGETDRGWQVFRHDLKSGETERLTSSFGDKRTLRYDEANGRILFRDSVGDVWFYRSGRSSRLIDGFARCSSYDFSTSRNTLYFARLATNNPQRQFLWKQGLDEASFSLLFRPVLGSIRQLRLSPKATLIAGSHITKIGEERIFIFNLSDETFEYLSPSNSVGAYPSWSSDGNEIYYSKEASPGSYDLYAINIEEGRERALTRTPDASELAACSGGDGKSVFYESRSTEGTSIEVLSLIDGSKRTLEFSFSAREPIWISDSGASEDL